MIRNLPLLLVIVLLLGCSMFDRQTKEEKEMLEVHLTEARLYFDTGLYEKAADQCIRILEIDPDHYEAKMRLGMSFLALGHYARAEEQLVDAGEEHPEDPMGALGLGMLYYELGRAENRTANARDTFADNLEEDGGDEVKITAARTEALKLRKLGTDHLAASEGHLKRCVTLNEARKQQPSGYVLRMLALCCAAQGLDRYDDAVSHMRRFIDAAVGVRATAEKDLKTKSLMMKDAVIQQYKNYVDQLKKTERKARIFTAWLHYERGLNRYFKGIERAMREGADPPKEPKYPDLNDAERFHLDQASVQLKEALALDPDTPEQHLNLAHISAMKKDLGTAVTQLRSYIRKNTYGDGDMDVRAMEGMQKFGTSPK